MRVLVVGLRATGAAVVAWLAARGDEVTVVEEQPGQPEYATRRAHAEALGAVVIAPADGTSFGPEAPDWDLLIAHADLVVPSPGVKPTHAAMIAASLARIPVRGDLDLAVAAATVPVIVVTGTNGKSTVTTLISAMLEASGQRAPAVGNIGRVVLDVLNERVDERPIDALVVEASSFQLHTVTPAFMPDVAVLLNLADDHLDWHGSFDAYVADKANVFRYQDPDSVLVANLDDPVVRRVIHGAPGRLVGFRLEGPTSGVVAWRGESLIGAEGHVLLVLTDPDALAPHERANLAAAAAAAQAAGATPPAIADAHRNFARLHHRTEPVGQAGGVTFVDDSKATNPHAAVAAICGFEHVVLLAGGESKGVDLGALRAVSERVRGVVAIGNTPEEVERAFAGTVPVQRASTMAAAVRTAAALAAPGDVVLLSPACASFDWYASYAERGDDFRREVEALIAEVGES